MAEPSSKLIQVSFRRDFVFGPSYFKGVDKWYQDIVNGKIQDHHLVIAHVFNDTFDGFECLQCGDVIADTARDLTQHRKGFPGH